MDGQVTREKNKLELGMQGWLFLSDSEMLLSPLVLVSVCFGVGNQRVTTWFK